ncbi:hypothetical protein N7492_006895 [Penicillium capsulatum]|uniref:Uncharacterized protein n=1 Tax=Penicillium capsulatum TaxID=69766 RepID=A0A9W9I125_9EURO|nr:hypothetical protein N7492_006895 [Penicillium capsulatum]KAJ6116729.1 hypothetical protein N7512_006454 [Penicillium capsulatum]
MANSMKEPARGLADLPTDLIDGILCAVSDINSLVAAIRAGSLFYNCYRSRAPQILRAVLHSQIEDELPHDALALAHISNNPRLSNKKYRAFLNKFHNPGQNCFNHSFPPNHRPSSQFLPDLPSGPILDSGDGYPFDGASRSNAEYLRGHHLPHH